MSDPNDNGHVIPFQKQNVPIVGQPFTLKNFFVTLQIVCNCDDKEPVLLIGNGIGRCPACRRAFQLQGIQPNPQGGLQFTIGLIAPQPAPPAAS